MNKKSLKSSLVVILGIFSIIMWYVSFNNRKLPNFSFVTVENKLIRSIDLENGKLAILILKKDNAFTRALLRQAIEVRSEKNKKMLVFSYYSQLKQDERNTQNAILIEDFDLGSLYRLFRLNDSESGWVLEYENGAQISKLHLTKKIAFKLIFAESHRDSVMPISDIIDKIMLAARNYSPGAYFITQQLRLSCDCYDAYESLLTWCSNHNQKLKLILVEKLTDLDLANFRNETADMVDICVADESISMPVYEWSHAGNRIDFNLILLKTRDQSFVYPLIHYPDYENWQVVKNFSLNTLLKDLQRSPK